MSQETNRKGSILCPGSRKSERLANLSQEIKNGAIMTPNMTHLDVVENGTNVPTRHLENGTKVPWHEIGTIIPN